MDAVIQKKMKDLVVQFDSSAALLKALASYLHSESFFDVGMTEKNAPKWAGPAVNKIPSKLRTIFYSWSGWFDAMPADHLKDVRSEDISKWTVSLFPGIKYDGIMFGVSNGAAIHICSALGIPWLPQTYLIAVKRFMHPDEIVKDIEWGKSVIHPFLEANPQLNVVQMHDPVQDRLMVQKMGYFRIKRRELGETFKKFIRESLNANAPLITVECRYPWLQYKAGDRHFFQLGGFGAMDAKEYLHGSDRVRKFLSKVNSSVDEWNMRDLAGEMREHPEGEWGFEPEILDDIAALARENNIPLKRLVFDNPEGLSDFTADLYRWWYEKRGMPSTRLIIENFGLIVPYDIIRTASVPFWLAFNTQPSYEKIKAYLRTDRRFEEIFLMLMSNGVTEGIGLNSIEAWREVLKYAKSKGDFIGVDENEYPMDFGTFLKYDDDLLKKIKDSYPPPEPLSLPELEQFIEETKGRYSVEWK
jgi:hypothetical protein